MYEGGMWMKWCISSEDFMTNDFSKICSVCKHRQASGRRVNRHCCVHHFADDEDKFGSPGAAASQRKFV